MPRSKGKHTFIGNPGRKRIPVLWINGNQEPAISIAAEDIRGLELSGDTNTAMPQIHDSTADTNAKEEQAQAS